MVLVTVYLYLFIFSRQMVQNTLKHSKRSHTLTKQVEIKYIQKSCVKME